MRLVYAPRAASASSAATSTTGCGRATPAISFYRAYVGKDGKPAAFAADNVPYQPKHFLKFADQPLGADDFVMVAGYPPHQPLCAGR